MSAQAAVAALGLLLAAAPLRAAVLMSVSVKKAVLREGPGSQYPVMWEALALTPLEILRWQDGWAKVQDYEGYHGWMHKSVLGDAPTVIVKVKKANLRAGPGLRHDVLWELEKEYALNVHERRGNWLKVSDPEVDGWIARSLVWGKTSFEDEEPRS